MDKLSDIQFDAFKCLAGRQLPDRGSTVRSTNVRGKTYVEIINARYTLAYPWRRLVPDLERYLAWQLAWFAKGEQNHDLANIVPRWPVPLSTKPDGTPDVNSNYGEYVWKEGQFDRCLKELRSNPDSRRALILFNRPSVAASQTGDHICTTSLQFLVVGESLVAIGTMRSNELTWSFPLDVGFFTTLQEAMAAELRMSCGPYHHNVGSLHAEQSAVNVRSQPPTNWSNLEIYPWPRIEPGQGQQVVDELQLLGVTLTDPHAKLPIKTAFVRRVKSLLENSTADLL